MRARQMQCNGFPCCQGEWGSRFALSSQKGRDAFLLGRFGAHWAALLWLLVLLQRVWCVL